MPARYLQPFVQDRHLSRMLPLTAIADTRMGIDADYYASIKLRANSKSEALSNAIGALPFSFESQIRSDLATFKRLGIVPFFVFSGLEINAGKPSNPFALQETQQSKLKSAWDLYDQGGASGDEASSLFALWTAPSPADLRRSFISILQQENVEFFVAPYSAWAQLAYFLRHSEEGIDNIYGPIDILLHDVDRVIVQLDLVSSNCRYVNKRALLNELGGINQETFVDLITCTGTGSCETLPILEAQSAMYNVPMNLKMAQEFFRTFPSVYNAVVQFSEGQNAHYLDKFKRAVLAVRYHAVMDSSGSVTPLRGDEAPSDAHEFLSQRLPEELYFYISRGVVSTKVCDALTNGTWYVQAPLEGGESREYREFAQKLEDIKLTTLNLLTQPLHRYYQFKPMKIVYWFDPGKPHDLAFRSSPPAYVTIKNWKVSGKILVDEMKKLHESIPGIGFTVRALCDSEFASATLKQDTSKEGLLKTTQEIIANTLWRVLQLRSFADGKTHQLTPWGQVLGESIKKYHEEENNDDDEKTRELVNQAIFIGVELLRFKVLSDKDFVSPQYSGGPIRGTEQEISYTRLISRTATLGLPLHGDEASLGFSGPLSRNLLAFRSFGASMGMNLRNLTEMTLFAQLANGDADRLNIKDWSELSSNALPFASSPNAGLGIIVKNYLDEMTNSKAIPNGNNGNGGESTTTTTTTTKVTSTKSKTQVLDSLRHMFPKTSTKLDKDLKRFFTFWDSLIVAVLHAEKLNLIDSNYANTFTSADKWLATKR